MFRATNSPNIRSNFWMYIQLLAQCIDTAADRCIVPKAVYAVKKCSWGWANLSPEKWRANLTRLINENLLQQHVNWMPRNRLPRVMKHYSPTGRRNHGRPLKRLLVTWDRNGSTSGPSPWQIWWWWWWWWGCCIWLVTYFVVLVMHGHTNIKPHYFCKQLFPTLGTICSLLGMKWIQTILSRTDEVNMSYKIMSNEKFRNFHPSLNIFRSW